MTDKNANKIGYKKTKLGWIPEDWEVVKLKNFAISLIGLTYRPENIVNKGLLVLRSSNIKNGKIVYNDNVFVNCLVPPKLLTQEDDILICVRNGSKNLVGKCAIVRKQDTNNSFGAFMSVIRSERNKYLYHFFQTDIARKQYLGTTSATINQITSKDLGLLNVVLPASYCEQKKIAEVLSCWDEGIEVLEKLLEKKQLLKKALMQGLLSGKIPLKNSQKNNSYKKTILGKIPSNWTVVKLKNIFTRLEEKNSKKNMLPVLTNSATQGVIYQNEYFDRSIVSETNTNNYYIVYPNAFMYNPRISKNAPAGPININKLGEIGIASPLYTIFYSKNDLCNSFYELYFNTNLWNKYMFNVANQGARHDRLNVTTKDFINMPLPCPPINEQQEIVEVLSSYDEEIKLLDKKLEMLKLQKKGLMQKLLTGEIRIKA